MKKLSSYVCLLFAALTLFSCNYARFDRPPGQALQEIPEKYRGKFFARASDKKLNSGTDTAYVVVGKDFYQELGSEKSRSKDKKMLGKDFIFCSYKGIDFIVVQGDDDSLFSVFPLEARKNGFKMYALDDYSKEERTNDKNLSGKYSKLFEEKCRKAANNETVWYYVMNEEKLYKAYRKKIKKMPGIDFIRTQ